MRYTISSLMIGLVLATQVGCSKHPDFVFAETFDGLRVGLATGHSLGSDADFTVQIENVGLEWKSIRSMYPNLFLEVVDGTGLVVASLSGDPNGTPDRVKPIDGSTVTNMPPKSKFIVRLQGNKAVSSINPGTYDLRAVLIIRKEDWSAEMRAMLRGRIDQLWTGRCISGSVRVTR